MASPSTLEAPLQRWAHPRVLVLASADVQRALAKSHLSFTEMLKPLGAHMDGVAAASFRSVSRNYTLKNFGVRFVAPSELEAAAALSGPVEGAASSSPLAAANLASSEVYLDSVLRGSEPPRERYSDGITEPGDVPSFLRTTPEPTPWFAAYRSEFHEVLRYHDSELLDQPMAILVAVSTTDPPAMVEQLRLARNLPPAFSKGVYDSPANLLRSIVVVHDKHLEATDPSHRERGTQVFATLKKMFGAEVLRMIELNSVPLGNPNLKQRDLWKADWERGRWQARALATKGRQNSGADSTVSMASASAAAAAPAAFLPPQPLPSSSPSGHPHPPSINTDHSSTYLRPGIPESPEPRTPSSLATSALSSLSGAASQQALEEMGVDESATVEMEQKMDAVRQMAEKAKQGPSAPFDPLSSTLPEGHVRGQYLSPNDLAQSSAFIADFVLKSLLPHLERKVLALGEKVAAVRKGFKNSIKAFFGKRSGMEPGKKASFNARLCTYDWNTVESQARQLADLAFIVQDYELAANTYRMCAGDYKQDKIARHFAASQEMLGLAIALGDTSGVINQSSLRELSQSFEAAVNSYLSVGDVRRSTRSAWFFADCLRWMGGQTKVNECSAVLLRASEKENSIRAALCMEQAAYLFLYHIPSPLTRKYSFHLVMSGHLFHKFQQKVFGVRAYNAATALYSGRAWFSVNDHLNYYLGKEYFHLNQYAESVRHFIELIGKSQSVAGVKPAQTQEKQTQFLKEFVFVVRKWQELEASKQALLPGGKSQLVPGLKLPTVADETVVVRTNDPTTVPSCYATQAWLLALRVNPLMTLEKEACNKPLWTAGWPSYKETERGCVVHEAIQVTFVVSNPLLIELPCSHMRLKCRWKLPGVDGAEDVESREGVAEGTPPAPASVFTYSTCSLTLAPLASVSITLSVTPLKQGVLHVEGMVWEVMDVLKGFHPFALPPRQVTFPVVGGRRRKPEMQPDPSLIIPVMPEAPLLELSLPAFPAHLHQGEVRRVVAKLRNRASVGLHKLCLRLSHPGFVVVAPPSDSGACIEHDWSEGYVPIPLTLQPGESVDLPLYVRGTLEGKQQIGFLLKYEPVGGAVAGGLKHRLAFLQFPLLVTPLFGMKVFTRPSFNHLADSLLGLEMQDKQQTIPGLASTIEYGDLKRMHVRNIDVRFDQISVMSRMWSVSPMEDAGGQAEEHHNELTAPRKLHSSVSSPAAMSSLKNDPAFVHARHNGAVHHAAVHGLPDANVLKPYESIVQFLRVTNLPGAFGVPPSAHEGKPVHISASANNLARDAHQLAASSAASGPRRVHHSFVTLNSPRPSPGAVTPIDPTHHAIAHLLHMEKALLIEEEKQTLIVNPNAVLADVGAANRLDFVCCWRSADGTRSGFFHAPGLASLRPQPAACSLKVLLSYPRNVSHDFVNDGSLDVTVGVAIRNTLEDAPVTFSFETLPPEEEFDAAKRSFRLSNSPCLRGRYTWSGSTKCRVSELGCGEQVAVRLFASFPSAGVYNLNRFRFTVEVAGKKPRVFFFPLQHLIHIAQAAAPSGGLSSHAASADPHAASAAADPVDLADGVGVEDPSLVAAEEASAADIAIAPLARLESVDEVSELPVAEADATVDEAQIEREERLQAAPEGALAGHGDDD